MTDMRATERLLEYVYERLDFVGDFDGCDAVAELQRRGDTLVRRDDLRKVIEGDEGDQAFWEARDRLEIALGGKLR